MKHRLNTDIQSVTDGLIYFNYLERNVGAAASGDSRRDLNSRLAVAPTRQRMNYPEISFPPCGGRLGWGGV